MRKRFLVCLAIACLLALAAALIGCTTTSDLFNGGSSRLNGPAPTTSTYVTAQGLPGDLWHWTIDRTNPSAITFNATNLTQNFTYSGTGAVLSNGFLKLTVTTSNDPNVGTLPKTVFTMEIPGVALIVQSAGENGHAGVGLAQADTNPCPTDGQKYNVISMENQASPAFAIAAVSGNGPYTFNYQLFQLDGTPNDPATDSDSGWTCDGHGKLTTTNDPGFTVQIGDTGLFLVDNGAGNGAVSGSIQEAVTLSDFLQNGREFRGVADAGGAVALWARPAGASTLNSGGYTDFETGTETGVCYVLNFDAADAGKPGILTGTFADNCAAAAQPGGGTNVVQVPHVLVTYRFVMTVKKITAFGSSKYVAIGIVDDFGTPTPFLMLEK